MSVLEAQRDEARVDVERLERDVQLLRERITDLETETEEQKREISAYENSETAAPHVDESLLRAAVPGPYHLVARGDDADAVAIEKAIFKGTRQDGSITFSRSEIEILERILTVYKSELHVSGAPDRVSTNRETVEAAVQALNSAREK